MSDRRTARRRAASGLAAVAVLAGSVVGLRPILLVDRDSVLPRETVSPGRISASASNGKQVPDVVGRTREEAENILRMAGLVVEAKEGSELPAGDPRIGVVERQQPEPRAGSLAPFTKVIIWIITAARPNCADTYPADLSLSLFVVSDFEGSNQEICFDPIALPGEPAYPASESLPRPCEPTEHPSDAQIEDRRGLAVLHTEWFDGDPAATKIEQVITLYRQDGAASYLRDVRSAVDSCGPVTRGGVRITYREITAEPLGDERLVLRVDYRRHEKLEGIPQTSSYLVSIVRVGRYVSVVYDKGWEGYPSMAETFEKVAREAAEKLSTVT